MATLSSIKLNDVLDEKFISLNGFSREEAEKEVFLKLNKILSVLLKAELDKAELLGIIVEEKQELLEIKNTMEKYYDSQDDDYLNDDPIFLLLKMFAKREISLVELINNAASQTLLATATGTNLDNVVALFNMTRLINEVDEELRERARQAFDGLGVAGLESSYVTVAKAADDLGRVQDVAVINGGVAQQESLRHEGKDEGTLRNISGKVNVYILSNEKEFEYTGGGTKQSGEASLELLDLIRKALNTDDRFPITDTIEVQTATIVPITIEVNLTLSNSYYGEKETELLKEARSKVESYLDQNHYIGNSISKAGLYDALYIEGVENVDLNLEINLAAYEITNQAKYIDEQGVVVNINGEEIESSSEQYVIKDVLTNDGSWVFDSNKKFVFIDDKIILNTTDMSISTNLEEGVDLTLCKKVDEGTTQEKALMKGHNGEEILFEGKHIYGSGSSSFIDESGNEIDGTTEISYHRVNSDLKRKTDKEILLVSGAGIFIHKGKTVFKEAEEATERFDGDGDGDGDYDAVQLKDKDGNGFTPGLWLIDNDIYEAKLTESLAPNPAMLSKINYINGFPNIMFVNELLLNDKSVTSNGRAVYIDTSSQLWNEDGHPVTDNNDNRLWVNPSSKLVSYNKLSNYQEEIVTQDVLQVEGVVLTQGIPSSLTDQHLGCFINGNEKVYFKGKEVFKDQGEYFVIEENIIKTIDSVGDNLYVKINKENSNFGSEMVAVDNNGEPNEINEVSDVEVWRPEIGKCYFCDYKLNEDALTISKNDS